MQNLNYWNVNRGPGMHDLGLRVKTETEVINVWFIVLSPVSCVKVSGPQKLINTWLVDITYVHNSGSFYLPHFEGFILQFINVSRWELFT